MKIQRVRCCVQCGDLLPQKCVRCLEHPDRKPRIVEIYDAPAIIQTLPCSCVAFLCQRPLCGKKVYRHLSADGKLKARNHFCSNRCNIMTTAAAKKTSVSVPCKNCGMVKEVLQCHLKARRDIFCKPVCYWEFKRKEAYKKNVLEARKVLLACYCAGHRGEVVEQVPVDASRNPGVYLCTLGGRTKEPGVKVPA